MTRRIHQRTLQRTSSAGRVLAGLLLLGSCALLLVACGPPTPVVHDCTKLDIEPATARQYPHHARLVRHLSDIATVLRSAEEPYEALTGLEDYLLGLGAGAHHLGRAVAAVERALDAEEKAHFQRVMAPHVATARGQLDDALASLAALDPYAAQVAAHSILVWLSPPLSP